MYYDDFCDGCGRDEDGLFRRGVHVEPFELRGKPVSLRTNVVSERNPRLEITTILESIYGKRNPILIYEKNGDQERLEIHNIGGIHPNALHYIAREIYCVDPEDIKIIPQKKCNTSKLLSRTS